MGQELKLQTELKIISISHNFFHCILKTNNFKSTHMNFMSIKKIDSNSQINI